MFPRPRVGDRVLYANAAFSRTSERGLIEMVVVRVGRRYFYLNESHDGHPWRERKITLERWSGPGYGERAYPSREAYDGEVEAEKLCGNLSRAIEWNMGGQSLSLDQLQRIGAIMQEEVAP